MATPRIVEPLFYWTPPGETSGPEVVLTGEEAHHVTVQRLRVGDVIALFNGEGLVIRGTIKTIERRAVHVFARERLQLPSPQPRLELYAAVPKGDRLSVMLDMATQLGMARFTPLRLTRSIAEPSDNARERWRRICVEACKQSRRAH